MDHVRRRRLGSAGSRLVLLASFAVTSSINYAFGLAAGWYLAPSDFGLLAFAQTILLICGLILNSGFAWSLTAALVKAPPAQHGPLVRGAILQNLVLAMLLGGALAVLFLTGPFRSGFETPTVLLLVVGALPFFSLIAGACATAQGLGRFGLMATIQMLEVAGKASGGLLLARLGFGATGAISGFLIGAVLATLLGLWVVVGVLGVPLRGAVRGLPVRTAGGMFGVLLAQAVLLNQDVLAVKLYAAGDRTLAGQYQAATVLANTPYYLIAALLPLAFTGFARQPSLAATRHLLGRWLGVVVLVVVPLECLLIAAPGLVLGLAFPHAYAAGAGELRWLALGNCAIVVLTLISAAYQATGHAAVPARVICVAVLCEGPALRFAVPVWGARGAAELFCATSFGALLVLAGLYARPVGEPAARRSQRFWSAGATAPPIPSGGASMPQSLRILALNHRCLSHPEAGGSEHYLFEIAAHWVRDGHQVTILTAQAGRKHSLPREEHLDGILLRRMGGRLSVFFWVAWFVLRFGRRYDRILDISNGLPFFVPLWTRTPCTLVVHHVHTSRWSEEFRRPLADIGRFVERHVVPRMYRRSRVVTGSPTTRTMLVQMGFDLSRIWLIWYGVQHPDPDRMPIPRKRRSIVYVGRLKRYKRVDQLVRMVADLGSHFPDLHLEIAGEGEAREELALLIDQLHAGDRVTLHGFIGNDRKSRMLDSASVFAMPSTIEGWGLSVIEANAHGCPAVGYDVPGVNAAIRHNETGLLATDYASFKECVAALLSDEQLRDRLSRGASRWAASFDWGVCARQTLAVLTGTFEPTVQSRSPETLWGSDVRVKRTGSETQWESDADFASRV